MDLGTVEDALHRASVPDDADEHAPIHPPNPRFSKKLEHHVAAVALHFLHYNFARIHQNLRVTPAMAAGVSDHVWEIEEIVALLGRK